MSRHASSSKGNISALVISVLLHALLIALLVFSGFWKTPPKRVSAAGEPIEATLMLGELPSSKAAKQAAKQTASRRTKLRPKPVSTPPPVTPRQPKPSPKPQQAKQPTQPKPQTQVPSPDKVAQQKAAELAKKKEAEKLKKAQEEKRRQEQILLEEQKKQEQAEQKERLAEQQKKEALEKERQEKMAKLEEIRKKKAELEAKRKREEARLQQMADANARASQDRNPSDNNDGAVGSPPPGNGGVDTALQGRYVAMIAQKVTLNWLRPDSARPGIVCKVKIAQIPGGEVIQANVVSPCNADALTQRSIEAAVLKAQPLPYQGFESVFNRNIIFTFRYDG